MADLPTNWVDNSGMVEDAAFVNLVGTNVNANSHAERDYGMGGRTGDESSGIP